MRKQKTDEIIRKLRVNKWLIRAVVKMYRNSNSVIRVNNIVVDKFDVEVGVHPASVLSTLLFVIVLEALPREYKSTLTLEDVVCG